MTASSTSGTVSTLAAVFIAGQTVACRTDIIDEKGGTATDTASVEIVNTAPTVTSVALTPEFVRTNDTVTAVASASDDDGDELTLSYAFAVDEVVVQEGSLTTLDGVDHFDKGQTVRVTVTASDGTDAHSLGSDSITVRDTPPTTPDIRIVEYADCEDGWVASEDRSQCFKIVSDPVDWPTALAGCAAEGGTLATIRSEGDNNTLYEMADGLGGESVWIGFNDRSEEGDWVWSSGEGAPYTNWLSEPGRVQPDGGSLENCAELFHSGVASPTWQGYWADMECSSTVHVGGYACETEAVGALQCVIDAGSTDADGDAVTYDFSWDVDGVGFTDTETTLYEGDTVPAEALGYEETWTCTVTPNDGDRDGESATASHTTECAIGSEAACPALDCNDLLLENPDAPSDIYWIQPLSDVYEVQCNMDTDGGGWTLVMKAVDSNFLYSDAVWTTEILHDETDLELTAAGEAKYQSFNEVPFDEILTTDPADFGISHSEVTDTTRSSALEHFSGPGDVLYPATYENYFNDRTPAYWGAWGCSEYDRYGFNLYESLGCVYIAAGMGCDHNGGARWGNRINGWYEGGGNLTGQGWASYSCSASTMPGVDTGTGTLYVSTIRELMWVR